MDNPDDEVIRVYCSNCNVQTDAQVIGTNMRSTPVYRGGDPVNSPCYVTVHTFAVCSE